MSNRVVTALRQIGPRLLFRGVIMVGMLIAAGVLIDRFAFEDILAKFNFSAGTDAGWMNGRAAFFVLAALFTAAGGPRQVVSFFAAYFFGLAAGFAIALAGTVTGSAIAVAAATVAGGMARRLIRGRADIAIRVWEANAFGMTLMIRLLPVGSNLVTNLAAGVAGIPLAGFFAGSAVGYVPQTLVFTLLGAGVNVGSGIQVGVSVVLFVISALIGVWIYARYRKILKRETSVDAGAEP